MASGGARSRSGPAPDPDALRRDRKDDAAGWTQLAADARSGKEPPAWPLLEQTDRERELWERFWTLPQAELWESQQLDVTVALFVRQLGEAEKPHSSAENRKTVRMWMADLYLTLDSLARARIKIVPADDPAQSPGKSRGRQPSARDRIATGPLTLVPEVPDGDDDTE